MENKYLTENARISNAYFKVINEGIESEQFGKASDDIRGIANNIRMRKRPDDDNFVSRELDMHDQIDRFEDSEYSDPDTVHKMHLDADSGKYGDVVARGYEARYNKNIKPKSGVKWSSVTNSPAAHLPFEKLNRGERPTNREVARAFDAAANNIDKVEISTNNVPDFNKEDHPEGFLDADFNDSTDESYKNESTESMLNSPDYKFYSIIETKEGWKINGGWEFKEDAIDDANEIKASCKECDNKVKVVGTRAVMNYVGNPDDDSSWVSGMYTDAMSESKTNMFNRGTGFYDKPRSNEEILQEFNSIEKEHVIGYDNDGSPVYVHYDVRDNSLWVNVNDEHIEIQFDRERDIDYNLNELYSKITEVTDIN